MVQIPNLSLRRGALTERPCDEAVDGSGECLCVPGSNPYPLLRQQRLLQRPRGQAVEL